MAVWIAEHMLADTATIEALLRARMAGCSEDKGGYRSLQGSDVRTALLPVLRSMIAERGGTYNSMGVLV